MTEEMTPLSAVAPTYEDALANLRTDLKEARREWSGVMMSLFPERWWMRRQAKRLKKRLKTGSVEFNAICQDSQVTICTSANTSQTRIPSTSSLCVITASTGKPLAVEDMYAEQQFLGDHPAKQVCRSWASYPVFINGAAAGTVCALDSPEPRHWDKNDEALLAETADLLAKRIEAWLERTKK